jgi:hypothetical protein
MKRDLAQSCCTGRTCSVMVAGVTPTTNLNPFGRNRARRPLVRMLALAAMFSSTILAGVMQLRVVASRDLRSPNLPGAQLAFSENADLLRVIGSRVATYDAATAVLLTNLALDATARILSIAGSGRTVLLGVRVPPTRIRLLLLDASSGQTESVPSDWYDSEDGGMDASVSSDGRLISVYSEGNADQPMVVTVYDWRTKRRVAQRASAYISAGGAFGGGITGDGKVQFVNNRAGRKLVDLETGRSVASFGFHSLRSANGVWVVEFPDRNWNETASRDVLVKDGVTAAVLGKLNAQLADDETFGTLTGSFCGATPRFVLARRASVGVYAIPAGNLLAEFPAASWRDRSANAADQPRVACSATGTRVAIYSGDRLTIHDMR